MKPTHRLKLLDKTTERKNLNAGAAWLNPDGSLSIQLSYGVVLSGKDADVLITLFPVDREEE